MVDGESYIVVYGLYQFIAITSLVNIYLGCGECRL